MIIIVTTHDDLYWSEDFCNAEKTPFSEDISVLSDMKSPKIQALWSIWASKAILEQQVHAIIN